MDVQRLLDLQRELQVEGFKLDPGSLQGEALADFVVWNALALTDEVHELLQEIQWKPWANDRGKVTGRGLALEEYVDALHFFMNLALAFGFSGQDIADTYLRKREENFRRQRQEGGYDAVGSKCPTCRRNLEEEIIRMYLDDETILEIKQCKSCGRETSRQQKARTP